MLKLILFLLLNFIYREYTVPKITVDTAVDLLEGTAVLRL